MPVLMLVSNATGWSSCRSIVVMVPASASARRSAMERLASSAWANHAFMASSLTNDRHVHVGSEPTGAAEGFQTASAGGGTGGVDQHDAGCATLDHRFELRAQSGVFAELLVTPAAGAVLVQRFIAEHHGNAAGEIIGIAETGVPVGAVFDRIPDEGRGGFDRPGAGVAQHVEAITRDQIGGARLALPYSRVWFYARH